VVPDSVSQSACVISLSFSHFFSHSFSLTSLKEIEKQKVRACSKCSLLSQSVSQSACVIIILMRQIIIEKLKNR
jgi:hypothetical protein